MNNNLFIITLLKLFSKKIAKAKNYIPVCVALDYYRISILSVCVPTKNLSKRKEKKYHIYLIRHPGRLWNIWALRVDTYLIFIIFNKTVNNNITKYEEVPD